PARRRASTRLPYTTLFRSVDRDAGQPGALVQRDAELVVGLEQLRVDLVEALRCVGAGLRRRVIRDGLIVDRRVAHVRPGRLLHRDRKSTRLNSSHVKISYA